MRRVKLLIGIEARQSYGLGSFRVRSNKVYFVPGMRVIDSEGKSRVNRRNLSHLLVGCISMVKEMIGSFSMVRLYRCSWLYLFA